MQRLVVLAALAACGHAALFIQRSDVGAQWYYRPGGSAFAGTSFVDSVNAQHLYPTYGIRYQQADFRTFAPAGNWLLVTDPISHNYREFATPIFSIRVAGAAGTWNNIQVPRNPYSAFHAVVVAAGPESRWTEQGDVVIFQPNPVIAKTLQQYNPYDLFNANVNSGTGSILSGAAPVLDDWVCLGWPILILNNPSDPLLRTGVAPTASVSANGAIRWRNAYCLVQESNVVAKVDLDPESSYPQPQRVLVNRNVARNTGPTELGPVSAA